MHVWHSLNIKSIIFIEFILFRKTICCWKWSHYFLGVVIIFGTNLTVRMEPQLINLRMRLNPNFFSKSLEKLGLSLIIKLISWGSILTVRLLPQIILPTSKSVNYPVLILWLVLRLSGLQSWYWDWYRVVLGFQS